MLGNLVFSPNMSVDANEFYSGILFQGETQTLKTNGVAVVCPIRIGFGWLGGTVSGISPNLTILDDLSIVRSADTSFGASLFTLERGTLNLNGKKLTISANSFRPGFDSNITSTRNLIFGGGSIEVQGNVSPWIVNATNLIVQGPGTINLTSASAKTFAGGGANYSGVTLVHGGAGNLTITGNNTFSSIRNTISQTAGSSIIFTSGSTTTITGKTGLSGTSSAPLYLASSSSGTYTINNSGTSIQQADYLSVNNSIVTPANNWFAGTRSTVTNSTGWSNTFSSAADLFWVGGSGTWDSATNTNWAVVSSGTGGTIAPTSINDVYFDSGSDSGSAFTVTLGTGAVNKNVTISGLDQIMTIAGSATWSCHGNIDIQSGALVVNSHTGSMNLNGTAGVTNTIFTSGVLLVPNNGLNKRLNINGGRWLVTSALTTNLDSYLGGLWLNSGIFDTQGYSLTSSLIVCNGSSPKELYFRNSTIITRRDGFFNNSTNAALLFDAGTSTINIGSGIS